MTCWAKIPMKYSLRSLMVVVTLGCLILARVAYLKSRVAFHESAAQAEYDLWQKSPGAVDWPKQIDEHNCWARAYGNAVYRPWVRVASEYEKYDKDAPKTVDTHDFMVATIVALLVLGWWLDRRRLGDRISTLEKKLDPPTSQAPAPNPRKP